VLNVTLVVSPWHILFTCRAIKVAALVLVASVPAGQQQLIALFASLHFFAHTQDPSEIK
jgi:hypothetical protein